MDLKEFAKNSTFNRPENDEQPEQKAKQIFDKYSSYSKGDLMNEITKIVKEQKKNGTFSKESILTGLQNFSAFIPADALEELKGIVERIDAEN